MKHNVYRFLLVLVFIFSSGSAFAACSGTTLGTAATNSTLVGTDFANGRAAGSITPDCMRDFVQSGPQWDVIGGSPAVSGVAGRLDGGAYFVAQGGALGTGQSTGQRGTNCTALNATISYAQTNGFLLTTPKNTIEISCVGGIVTAAELNFIWQGSGTNIIQFYNSGSGAPVLTLGAMNTTQPSGGWRISGLNLGYGAAETGNVAAVTLRFGYISQSSFEKIAVCGNNTLCGASATAMPYDSVHVGEGIAGDFWSNSLRDFFIWGWQNSGVVFNASGSTGNLWSNWYMGCGSGAAGYNFGASFGQFPAITGNFLDMVASGEDQHFDRMNFEGCVMPSGKAIIDASGGDFQSAVFTALHMEHITFQGANPIVFYLAGQDSVLVNGWDMFDVAVSSTYASGTLMLESDYTGGSSQFHANNFTLELFPDCYTSSIACVNLPIQMLAVVSGPLGDQVPVAEWADAQFNDASGAVTNQFKGNIGFDEHQPADAAQIVTGYNRYKYGAGGSTIDRANITISSTDTVYCSMENTTILVPTAITNFTLTFSNAQGSGATSQCRAGTWERVRRQSGSASGTLTVSQANGGSNPGISAPNTGGTDNFYQAVPYISATTADAPKTDFVNVTAVP